MGIFLTADWHLGEERLAIMQRDVFESTDDMLGGLLHMHNKRVKESDLVYVIGDVLFKGADPENLRLIDSFNGRKILIRGNHDAPFTDEQFAPYFEEIIPEGEGVELTIEGIDCYLTHYPTQARKDRFNIVGHIHGAWKYQLNMMNVGVDANHFCPVNAESIPFHFKAIADFYDEDVWVAYDEVNASYRESRGKKSRYFNG